jgi:site-specific recombinase XerD
MRTSTHSFYPYLNDERVERIFSRGLAGGLITLEEGETLREYLAEYKATRHIKIHRVIKTVSDLIQWRRFLKVPYHEAKIKDVHSAISGMMGGTSLKGTPFAANTKHDYVKALRAYLLWMIETGKSSLDEKRVRKIKIPPRDYITRSPDEILTSEETAQIIEAAGSNRDRALIAVLYETGMRIGEVALLRWKDLTPDETGIGVHIRDEKTKRERHSRIIDYREHISSWRKEHPGRNNPDAPVFIDRFRKEALEYQAIWMIIKKAAERAGVTKRVHAHLFRSSRVTHLVRQGYSESVIKKMIWGNVNTRVYQTYCILSDQDIDRELNEKAGVVKARDPETVPTRPRKCPECGHINTPTSEWCGKCMNPLTEEAQSHREQLIQDVVRHWDVLPEAYRRMQESAQK